jgi:hypothetical protein
MLPVPEPTDQTPPAPDTPPAPRPGPSATARAAHYLAGRDLDRIKFRLHALHDFPGRYHLVAEASERVVYVETAASGTLDELESFYRRHIALIAAERERLAARRPEARDDLADRLADQREQQDGGAS